jgi:hypothetical protein
MSDKKAVIVEVDPQKLGEEFADLVARCYKNKPAKEDIKALRKWLEEKPEFYKAVFDLSDVVTGQTIAGMIGEKDVTTKSFVVAQIKAMKKDFGYQQAPILEKLLVENIVLAWLRYLYAEYQLTTRMQTDATYTNNEHWEKRTSAAQRRYLRAIETLARVRKLTRNTPALQVNIATEGGQQVNVGGDLTR